jgi:Ser/Thr protein kinase RdoA (MazF antagonist)
MRSSQLLDLPQDVAGRLCPEPVRAIAELRRGNNSRIFRVDTRRGSYALKRYPASDERNRLEAESRALAFFERQGIAGTPRLVALERETRFALLTWVEGEPVAELGDADIAEFAAFQLALDRGIDARARREIGEASEACLSGRRILSHIERRFRRLAEVAGDQPDFFTGELVPALREFEAAARAGYRGMGLDFDADLPAESRTLIPSDLGAHNALRGPDGRLRFLDFEYFGWDDPITSIANFVWHPGMRLADSQRAAYRDALLAHFRERREAERLAVLMPLYALRWCAIILGELLPERWRHRQESNADLGEWEEARRAQIGKARALLARFRP